MHFFTLRIDKDINSNLDKISVDTSISKSNLILFAMFTLINKDFDITNNYPSNSLIRTGIRIPIRLNEILDDKIKKLNISKNSYINSLLNEFLKTFEYI